MGKSHSHLEKEKESDGNASSNNLWGYEGNIQHKYFFKLPKKPNE